MSEAAPDRVAKADGGGGQPLGHLVLQADKRAAADEQDVLRVHLRTSRQAFVASQTLP